MRVYDAFELDGAAVCVLLEDGEHPSRARVSQSVLVASPIWQLSFTRADWQDR